MRSPLAIVGVLIFSVAARSSAQTATIGGDLLKDWKAQKETMLKIADAMPEDKYGYKSTPAQRSYAEQILHVAGANVMLLKFVGAKAPVPFPVADRDLSVFGLKVGTKAEVMQALARSYDYGEAVLKDIGEAGITQTITGPPWIGAATRAKMFYFTLGHTQDIYGQLVVYLRLNGIVPPASRRGGV